MKIFFVESKTFVAGILKPDLGDRNRQAVTVTYCDLPSLSSSQGEIKACGSKAVCVPKYIKDLLMGGSQTTPTTG